MQQPGINQGQCKSFMLYMGSRSPRWPLAMPPARPARRVRAECAINVATFALQPRLDHATAGE